MKRTFFRVYMLKISYMLFFGLSKVRDILEVKSLVGYCFTKAHWSSSNTVEEEPDTRSDTCLDIM